MYVYMCTPWPDAGGRIKMEVARWRLWRVPEVLTLPTSMLRGDIVWVPVSEPDSYRFWAISLGMSISIRNEAYAQCSLLGTIFNYIVHFGRPGRHLSKS